jgi:uncharacterized membrane protein
MLVLAYVGEGLVRATSDRGPSAQLALIEILLAAACFAGCAIYARLTRGRGAGDA